MAQAPTLSIFICILKTMKSVRYLILTEKNADFVVFYSSLTICVSFHKNLMNLSIFSFLKIFKIIWIKINLGQLDWIFIFENTFYMGQRFKNGPSKICGRQPLKNLKGYYLPKADHTSSNILKAVFHKFYLVHSWILSSIYCQ